MKVLAAVTFIYCLFSFKYNIFGPIRLDDFFIAFFSFAVISFRLKIFKPISLFFCYFLWSLLSLFFALINSKVYALEGGLFVLRALEYFLFFYVGFFFRYDESILRNIFKFYLIYALLLIFLQKMHVVGVLSGFTVDRAIANAGGPWELALITSFIAIYFFVENERFFLILALFILILTESRVTFLGTLLALTYIYIRGKITVRHILFFILLLPVSIFVFVNTNLYDRYENVLSSNTFDVINQAISSSYPVNSQDEYVKATYGSSLKSIIENADGDASAAVRFTRWAFLLKTVFNNYDTALLGIGPSFAGKAVDGNYVRLLVENGVIGFLIFIFMLSVLFFKTESLILRGIIISLMFSSLLIDAFTTYKAMMIFWFYIGYLFQSNGFYKNKVNNKAIFI